jgi:hypothetical protein
MLYFLKLVSEDYVKGISNKKLAFVSPNGDVKSIEQNYQLIPFISSSAKAWIRFQLPLIL